MYDEDMLLLVPHVAFFVPRLSPSADARVGDDEGTIFDDRTAQFVESLCQTRTDKVCEGSKKAVC